MSAGLHRNTPEHDMGDRAILGSSSGNVGMGSLHLDRLDANSKLTESFTEARALGGKTVYLTRADAERFDGWDPDKATVHTNGTTIERLKATIAELLEW